MAIKAVLQVPFGHKYPSKNFIRYLFIFYSLKDVFFDVEYKSAVGFSRLHLVFEIKRFKIIKTKFIFNSICHTTMGKT